MPFHLTPTFAARLAGADRPLFGLWVVSGSPVVAEIVAGSGTDLVFVDGEHSANSLESIQTQLQVIAAYPVTPVVRVPVNDAAVIKQYLDIGVQNLIVPMVDTGQDAARAISATRYPPHGVRGVGSALARASRWNRVDDYLANATQHISVTVQIESATAVDNAEAILATPGVDAVFIGPSDLAASMGVLGQQDHPDVVSAVNRVLAFAREAGVKAGVNAFAVETAERYVDSGADFVFVGADVALLARSTESLVARFRGAADSRRGSY